MQPATAIRPLSLYHIDEDLRALEEALLESGGDISPEMEEKYAELLTMQESKVEGYISIIRKFEASATGIEEEEKRLAAAKKTMQNAARSLKDRLCNRMLQRNESEYMTRLGKVKLQRSGSRPVLLKVPAEQLPEWFKRITVSADLKALGAALKEGEATDFAELGEASAFIRIY